MVRAESEGAKLLDDVENMPTWQLSPYRRLWVHAPQEILTVFRCYEVHSGGFCGIQIFLRRSSSSSSSGDSSSIQGCQVHHLSMSEIPSMTRVAKKKCHSSLRYILSVPDIGIGSKFEV